MSTKIFHGWIIKGVTLERLLPRLFKFRDAVREQANRIVASMVARMATMVADSMAMDRKKLVHIPNPNSWHKTIRPEESLFSFCWLEVDEEVAKAFTSSERSVFDIQCSMTLHPSQGSILALLFNNDQKGYEKLFQRIVGAKPLPYWDNTDKPKELTDRQWRARGRRWDKALGTGVPAENGYSFECLTKYGRPHPKLEDVLRQIPFAAERQRDISFDRALQFRLEKLRAGRKTTTGIFGDICDVRRWLKEKPEGQVLVRRFLAKAISRLQPITRETLERKALDFYRVKEAGNGASKT